MVWKRSTTPEAVAYYLKWVKFDVIVQDCDNWPESCHKLAKNGRKSSSKWPKMDNNGGQKQPKKKRPHTPHVTNCLLTKVAPPPLPNDNPPWSETNIGCFWWSPPPPVEDEHLWLLDKRGRYGVSEENLMIFWRKKKQRKKPPPSRRMKIPGHHPPSHCSSE